MRINSVFFFTVHIMNDINVQNMNNEQNNQDHFNVIRKIKPVNGRMEKVGKINNNSCVILDFAHTPEALMTC